MYFTETEHHHLIYFLVGYFDLAVEGDWRWIDCTLPSEWALSNWAADQPNDLDGAQECGQILQSGLYNDWRCDRTMQYICEINVIGE